MTEGTPTPEQQKRTTREPVRLVAAIVIIWLCLKLGWL